MHHSHPADLSPPAPIFRRLGGLAASLPLAVFILALVPRLIDIGRRPFWLDEAFTVQRVSLAPAALVQDSFANHHMPAFFLMLSALTPLGNPQFWLRIPSAAFGALAVTLVYLIAARIAGRWAGCLAALILGLSPTALAFSQEARSYTMEMSLILVALFGIVLLARDIPRASVPLLEKGSPRWAWACFALGSAAALDVLGDGTPWVITANLIGGIMVWRSPRKSALIWNFVIADLIIAVLSVPLYIVMARTVQGHFADSFAWIPPLDASRIWYNFGAIYLMRVADWVTFRLMVVPTPKVILWLIDAGLIVSAGLGVWRLRHRPGLLAAVAMSFAILPVATLVISIWKPLLLPRYILWSAAPFAILAGIGASLALSALPRFGRGIAFAGIAALLLVNLLPYYSAETKPRWDVAAQILASEVAPGDVIFLSDAGALPVLRLYLPKDSATVVLQDSNGDLQHAEAAQAAGKRVWAVFGHAGQSGGKQELPKFYQQIAPLGAPSQLQMAGDRIYINLFDGRAQNAAQACLTIPPNAGVALPGNCG